MTRILRVYHAGRDAGHRARERALLAAGAQVTLVVPRSWPAPGSQPHLSAEPFEMIELEVRRPGDVNRHHYADPAALSAVVRRVDPDVIDIHEEPVSLAGRQWLRAAGDRPVVMYTAQNIDKRFPPPFAQYEQAALNRVQALYPCSRQAASVARGKGFGGLIDVLPLGLDTGVLAPGDQSATSRPLTLGLVGRMVPEKGVIDAVRVLAAVCAQQPAQLSLIGDGPELAGALDLARRLGVDAAVRVEPWVTSDDLAKAYSTMDVVLVPSRATATWVEQFGRVVLEAQACGAVVAGYASGAIPEVSGGAAILTAEGDVATLARAVTQLVADSARFEQLRILGLANAEAASWAAVAARQAALYRRVAESARGGLPPARIPAGRSRAAAEFGPPASVLGQIRPFALPYLRNPTPVSRTLGWLIDRGRP